MADSGNNKYGSIKKNFRKVIDTIPIGISLSTPEGEIIDVNSTFLKMFGDISREDFLKEKASKYYFDPVDRKRFIDLHKGGKIKDFVVRFKRLDGTYFWGSISSDSTTDENNNKCFINTIIDITEQKLAREALNESYQTLENLVNVLPIGIFVYKFEYPEKLFLISGNKESKNLTGVDANHWIGKEFNEIWPEAKQSGFTDELIKVMMTGKTYETENLFYKDDKLEGVFRIRAFFIPNNRLIVAFDNITDREK